MPVGLASDRERREIEFSCIVLDLWYQLLRNLIFTRQALHENCNSFADKTTVSSDLKALYKSVIIIIIIIIIKRLTLR